MRTPYTPPPSNTPSATCSLSFAQLRPQWTLFTESPASRAKFDRKEGLVLGGKVWGILACNDDRIPSCHGAKSLSSLWAVLFRRAGVIPEFDLTTDPLIVTVCEGESDSGRRPACVYRTWRLSRDNGFVEAFDHTLMQRVDDVPNATRKLVLATAGSHKKVYNMLVTRRIAEA